MNGDQQPHVDGLLSSVKEATVHHMPAVNTPLSCARHGACELAGSSCRMTSKQGCKLLDEACLRVRYSGV